MIAAVTFFIDFILFLVSPLVFKVMWSWFIAETFSLKELTYLESFGVLLVLSLFARRKFQDMDEEESLKQTLFNANTLLVILLTGLIIKTIMG